LGIIGFHGRISFGFLETDGRGDCTYNIKTFSLELLDVFEKSRQKLISTSAEDESVELDNGIVLGSDFRDLKEKAAPVESGAALSAWAIPLDQRSISASSAGSSWATGRRSVSTGSAMNFRFHETGFLGTELAVSIFVESREGGGRGFDFFFGEVAAAIGVESRHEFGRRRCGRAIRIVLAFALALTSWWLWLEFLRAEGSVLVFVEFEQGF
jgi:hypothetical protein